MDHYYDTRCVYANDMAGDILWTICKNESGEGIFSYICDIAMNKTGDRLYVTDDYNGLICTDRAGKEMFRLSDKELGLTKTYGVCTYKRGNVLVSVYHSNNVVQNTEDGQIKGEILSTCMCYDEVSRRLHVGGKTSNLLMYKLD